MRERKRALYHCKRFGHTARITYMHVTDPRGRALQQAVLVCSMQRDQLCRLSFYPEEGESLCPAVEHAHFLQFR